MTPTGYSEDTLVEQPAIALLAALGWETDNAYHEFDHGASTLGRETPGRSHPHFPPARRLCNGSTQTRRRRLSAKPSRNSPATVRA